MPTTDEQRVQHRILAGAEKLFTTYGSSRVSMDELAAELGMSKKTLYKHFPTKEALLLQVIEAFYAQLNADIEAIRLDEALTFPEKMMRFITLVATRVAVKREPFVHDLQRNAPQVWARIHTLRRETIQTQFRALVQEGAQRGIFRPDLDPQLITLIVLAATERLTDPDIFDQHTYSFTEIFEGIMQVVLKGILADKEDTEGTPGR